LLYNTNQMRIKNSKASQYTIEEKKEAGIVLTGAEVKAIKGGHANLDSAYVKIMGMEAFLINSKVFPYPFARAEGYDPSRSRKLLLHKSEILAFKTWLNSKGRTLVPLSMYEKQGKIKLEIALVKGKKQYDHKADLKRKDLDRRVDQELKKWG